MLTVEKTKLDFEISIEITIAVIAFLLSISTNFIDKKIYNNAILFLALISLTIHCLKKKQLKIRSKTIYLAILVTIIIGYNFLIAQVAAKKLLI